jgi:hypothetical protein
MRRRFYVEGGLAVIAGVLALLTFVWHDWIEIAFRLDADAGSGALEWALVLLLALAAIAFAVAARLEWRRAATA